MDALHPVIAASLAALPPCTTPGAIALTLTLDGVTFHCEAEYEPAERGSWEDGPGYPAQAHIYAARIGGIDMLGMLAEPVVDRLRDKALEYFCD